MITRRTFIKVGISGAALFAAARLAGGAQAAAPTYRLLDEKAAGIVRALAPVVLAASLPNDAAARERAIATIVLSFDRGAAGLAPTVQREITDLFAFLEFAPTRVAFTGLWAPITESTAEELSTFLTRWRNSRYELQHASYQALKQLIYASWYDMPEAWPGISYPGPPELPK